MTDSEKSGSVLFVDDECELLEGFIRVCEKSGWKAVGAHDGRDALELFKAEPVDVVVTDLLMPRLDGAALVNELRNLDHDVPIIVLTGYASLERCAEALRAGATDFLTKPVSNEKLSSAIQQAFELREKRIPQGDILKRGAYEYRVSLPASTAYSTGLAAHVKSLITASGFGRKAASIVRAVEEAFKNAVIHGAPSEQSNVTIKMKSEDDLLRISIADSGSGFHEHDSNSIEPNGGLFLIKSYCDRVKWQYDESKAPGRHWVEMEFFRPGRPNDVDYEP